MSRAKADRPETLREARSFEMFKRQHLNAGLCHVCASQGAYGRQLGFSRVGQPCAEECRAGASQVPELAGWLRPSAAGRTAKRKGQS